METILGILREVRDPRAANAQHDLGEVLFIALCAFICGAQTCCEIAVFGPFLAEGHERRGLGEAIQLRHRPPEPFFDALNRCRRRRQW